MAKTLEIQRAVSIGFDVCAEWFAQADSEEQGFFFRKVAALAEQWPDDTPACFQWHAIGRELADNPHFYDKALSMLREIVAAAEPTPKG